MFLEAWYKTKHVFLIAERRICGNKFASFCPDMIDHWDDYFRGWENRGHEPLDYHILVKFFEAMRRVYIWGNSVDSWFYRNTEVRIKMRKLGLMEIIPKDILPTLTMGTDISSFSANIWGILWEYTAFFRILGPGRFLGELACQKMRGDLRISYWHQCQPIIATECCVSFGAIVWSIEGNIGFTKHGVIGMNVIYVAAIGFSWFAPKVWRFCDRICWGSVATHLDRSSVRS